MMSGAPRTWSASRGRTPSPKEPSDAFERSSRVPFSSRSAGTSVPTGSGLRSDSLAGATEEFAGASDGPVDATSAAGGAGVGPGAEDGDRTTRTGLVSPALAAEVAAPVFAGR